MNFLPKELEDIIVDYKNNLETHEKFSQCLGEIKNISCVYSSANNNTTFITQRRHNECVTAYIYHPASSANNYYCEHLGCFNIAEPKTKINRINFWTYKHGLMKLTIK